MPRARSTGTETVPGGLGVRSRARRARTSPARRAKPGGTATTATTCGHRKALEHCFATRCDIERHSTAGSGYGRENAASATHLGARNADASRTEPTMSACNFHQYQALLGRSAICYL